MIIGIHIYQVKIVCRVLEWLLPFVLSPLNLLECGKLVHSINLIPFEIFLF